MALSSYSCLPLDQIKNLPVGDLAALQCVLALWATGPKMPEALGVMDAWGFRYLTVLFTWVKQYRSGAYYSGLGHYTKSGTEFVLLGRRGSPLPRLRRDIRQIIAGPVTGHSAKPPEVRDRIVDLFGDIPRIELFARERVVGWDSWGDELTDCPGRVGAPSVPPS